MDRMEIVGADGATRFVVDGTNVFTPKACKHTFDEKDRCRLCGRTRFEVQQSDESHNQF